MLEYSFCGKKLFETFDKKAWPSIMEANRNMVINQLYALQNILPNLHQKTFGGYEGSLEGKEVVLMANGPTLNKYVGNNRLGGGGCHPYWGK